MHPGRQHVSGRGALALHSPKYPPAQICLHLPHLCSEGLPASKKQCDLLTLLKTKKGEEHLKSQGYFVFTIMNVSVEDAAVVLKSCIVSIEFLLLCGPHSLKAEELPALKGQCIVYFLNSTLNLAFLVSFKLRHGSPL